MSKANVVKTLSKKLIESPNGKTWRLELSWETSSEEWVDELMEKIEKLEKLREAIRKLSPEELQRRITNAMVVGGGKLFITERGDIEVKQDDSE